MWDINSSQNSEETTSNKQQQQQEQQKKIGEKNLVDEKNTEIENQSSSYVDSGFMSGPQLSGYDTSDGEGEDMHINKEEQQQKEKEDKKFLNNKTATPSITVSKEFTDSGCGATNNNSSSSGGGGRSSGFVDRSVKISGEDITTDSGMFLDSDIDVGSGLIERFSNLNLKQQKNINNLNDLSSFNNKNKKSKNNIRQQQQQQQQEQKEPWEIYYKQDSDGDTQLHIACASGYTNVIPALIYLAPHPCLFDIRNDISLTALHIAVLTQQVNIIRMLLVSGASPIERDGNGNTPLHLACIYGDINCVIALTSPISAAELQEKKYLTDKQKIYLHSILTSKISSSSSSHLIKSLQLPQDLEIRNYDGEHCIHLATKNNHINIIRYLVSIGGNINAREGKSGLTPLHLSIEMGNEKLVNFLLDECKKKLNLETETFSGLTAYQLAVMVRLSQIQQTLQKFGAEPLTPPDSDEDESDSDEINFDTLQNEDKRILLN